MGRLYTGAEEDKLLESHARLRSVSKVAKEVGICVPGVHERLFTLVRIALLRKRLLPKKN